MVFPYVNWDSNLYHYIDAVSLDAMKKFELLINMDNDAFVDNAQAEVIRILKRVIEKIESGQWDSALFDINGNNVGNFFKIEFKKQH